MNVANPAFPTPLPGAPLFNGMMPNFPMNFTPPTGLPGLPNATSKTQDQYHKAPFRGLVQYSDDKELRETFEPLAHFNETVDLNEWTNQKVAFFVIRSKTLEDIHKAVKYGVWTSSPFNNRKFRTAKEQGHRVVFFFTYMKSNKFVGAAELVSLPNPNKEFPYWGEIGKWKGIMHVRWLFVRDLYFDSLSSLTIQDQPLFELKDGTDVSSDEGLFLMKTFSEAVERSEMFKVFYKLDEKEKELRVRADMIIDQGAMEEKTKEHEQKKQNIISQRKPEAEEEVLVVVSKKKMTQGEKKKLLKSQKNQPEETQ